MSEMANSRSDLFKWKRKTDPLEAARGRKKDSMKDWIKKIRDASEKATLDTFGSDIFHSDSLREIVPDDEAVYEAQELIDGWLQEKKFPDLNQELAYKDEAWCSSSNLVLDAKSQLRNESDSDILSDFRSKYLSSEESEVSKDSVNPTSIVHHEYTDYFMNVHNMDDSDDIDDSLLVQEVLTGMMNTDVAKNIDLGMKPLIKKVKNPLPKMNLRHQQVKARGQERKQKHASARQERQTKKEIEQKARERLILEEKQAASKHKHEEKAIQMEMVKIRKELEDEKRLRLEETKRKNDILNEAKFQMQEELKKQREEELAEKKRRKVAEEKMRLHIHMEVQEKSVAEIKENMKILHKHFSAWYDLVLEQRLNSGKARAVSDWKCKLRAWNAWRAYVMCIRSNEAAKAMEQAVKEKYRKEQMALRHYNNRLQRTCLICWLKYAHYRVEKKSLLLEHEEKAKKMAKFLEEASKGLLWDDQNTPFHLEEKKNGRPNGYRKQIQELKKQNLLQEMQHQQQQILTKQQQILTQQHNNDERKLKVQQKSSLHSNRKNKISEQADPSNHKVASQSDVRETHASHNDVVVTELDFTDINHVDTERTSSERSTVISTVPSRKAFYKSEKVTTKPLRLAMEERERQRMEKRLQIEGQKRKRDEEKLRELREKETDRLHKEEVEKDERLKKKREERRLAVQKEKEKQIRLEQIRQKNDSASSHYQLHLLRKFGTEPWKRLIQIKRLNLQIADKYRNGTLLRIVMSEWHLYTQSIVVEKNKMAQCCYERLLLRRSLRSWQKVRFNLQSLNKLARRHNLHRIIQRAFNAWQDFVTDERILMWAKESTADDHNQTRIQKKYLHTWISFVKDEKDDRIREVRRKELRMKVQQWLPDFKGKVQDAHS